MEFPVDSATCHNITQKQALDPTPQSTSSGTSSSTVDQPSSSDPVLTPMNILTAEKHEMTNGLEPSEQKKRKLGGDESKQVHREQVTTKSRNRSSSLEDKDEKHNLHLGRDDDDSNDDFENLQRYWNRRPLSPLRSDDKQRWPGFREIETDPQDFESMLRLLGVKGLVVREVFGLDKDSLDMMPRIRGFIFCSRVDEEAEDPDLKKQVASCPPEIWFANQTHEWLCGSNALLNIVNNLPDVDLGEHLTQFKNFTRDFTPAQRGDAVANFEFLRRIHNSGLRKMEILAADVDFMERYGRQKRPRKEAEPPKKPKSGGKKSSQARRKGGGKSVPKMGSQKADEEIAFHYTAFLPLQGYIWKLDGLDRQPVKLCACSNEDWHVTVGEHLQARLIAAAEDDIEFSAMAICQENDRLAELQKQLTNSTSELQSILRALEDAAEKARDDKEGAQTAITNEELRSTLDASAAGPGEAVSDAVWDAKVMQDVQKLRLTRDELLREQQKTKDEIKREEEVRIQDEGQFAMRRHDYEPLVRTWLEMLAHKEGIVRQLIDSTI